MDLSALIFVALAVAWAVYLVPKALKHHEEDRVSRSVERFSDRVRILAHREPVSASRAALVVDGTSSTTPPAAEDEPADAEEPAAVPTPATPMSADPRPDRSAAARAARRRRRVLGLVLLANVAMVALAAAAVVAWAWVAAPATALVAWLVACRLMVRRERAAAPVRVRKRRTTLADEALAEESAGAGEVPPSPAEATVEPVDPDAWDPVPVTLPTYVDKATAGRSVRTIDLDSTGVWSSGRNAADSALAREAEQQERPAQDDQSKRRASGA